MDGRADPVSNWDINRKESLLQELQDWLTPEFLQEATYHPVRDLWNRKDNISTVELLTFSNALQKVKNKMSPKSLKLIRNDICSDDFGNSSGFLFEMMAGAMFERGGHKISYPKASEKGFDIYIEIDTGKQMRLSCKCVIPSKEENDFKLFSNEIHENFIKYARTKTNNFRLVGVSKDLPDEKLIENTLKEKNDILKKIIYYYDKWLRNGKNDFIIVNEWLINFSKLNKPAVQYKYYPKELSYNFLFLMKFTKDEQRRFYSKVKEAIEKFHKHCTDIGSNFINVVMLKIPNSISINKATEWVIDYFNDPQNKEISKETSSVLIYRHSITSHETEDKTFLGFEHRFVHNPNAIISLLSFIPKDFKFKLEVPIGLPLLNEPVNKLYYGEKENDFLDVTNGYYFMRGHFSYMIDFDTVEKNINKTVNIDFIPNTSSSLFFNIEGKIEEVPLHRFHPEELILI